MMGDTFDGETDASPTVKVKVSAFTSTELSNLWLWQSV